MHSPETTDTSTLPLRHLEEATDKGPKVAVSSEQTSPDPAPALCPRCGGKLISPESLGWCPKCRYCRTVEEDAPKVARASSAVATSSLGMVEFFNLVSRLPRWFWIMTGGSAVIAVISAASQYLLPPECLARAVWSTTQLGLGIVVLIAAQVWALIVMAPEDDRLSAKDIIFAIRLWALVSKRLPAMARQLWLGVWAGSAMLCAIFLVGGLSYWTRYYKPERVADKNLIQAAMALAQGKADNKSLTESVEDFAATQQELTKQKPEKDDNKVDKRPTVHCVILGYNLGPDKQLTELVLGTLRDSSVRYAGRVQQGFSPEQSKQLLEAMKNLVVTAPLIADLQFPAIWVKPQLFCEVHQSGYDDQGHLKNPRYHGLLIVE